MRGPRDRERTARLLGVAAALAAMTAASLAIDWPAPGASAALGLLVWAFVRGGGRADGGRSRPLR